MAREKETIVTTDGGGGGAGAVMAVVALVAILVVLFLMFGGNLFDGGTEKIDGAPPSPEAVADRLALIRHAMDVLFHGRPKFQACWTYITCVNGR